MRVAARHQRGSLRAVLLPFRDALSTFTFKSHDIRVIDREGNPWFVARDVCDALGYPARAGGVSSYLHVLSADEKFKATRRTTSNLFDGGYGASMLMLISESGLYKLVMRSDKPEARAFQDWVTRDVLPAIRKDGAYVMGEEKVRTGKIFP